MDKITDLSTAIMLGSRSGGQCFKTLYDLRGNTCVVGAAMVGVGMTPSPINVPKFQQRFFNQLQAIPEHCPACPAIAEGVDMLVHLNDTHRWSRSQIAFWLSKQFPRKNLLSNEPTPSKA